MKARIIPAKTKSERQVSTPMPIRLTRVCAYARVSTEKEEQESSYEVQCAHYTKFINDNPEWEFAGIYADEGLSGVLVNNREQFLKMIADCEAGKIDMILTKSISRFARNTLDTLTYLRKLKALEIPVFFEKEQINSMDSRGELTITLLASLAQQESESISHNVQTGIRFRFQEGKVCAGHERMLGYRRTPDGRLEIVPEEAEMVRKVYRLYLDGYTPKQIGEIMRATGFIDRRGNERSWCLSTVNYLLSNEKYMGDLCLQKYCTPDFLTKKHVRNKGQMPQYYVENSHLPIVPKEIFYRVQGEKQRRIAKKGKVTLSNSLCGKTFCAECGTRYLRKTEQHGRTKFRCGTKMHRKYRIEGVECDNPAIVEEDLQEAVMRAFQKLPAERQELLLLKERINWGPIAQADQLLAQLEDKINGITLSHEVGEELNEEEREEIRMLQEQMAEVGIKKAEFLNREAQIRTLLSRIDAMRWEIEPKKEYGAYCTDVDEFFDRTKPDFKPGTVKAFSEDDTTRFVERINIGKDKIEVVFWAGVSIEVARG